MPTRMFFVFLKKGMYKTRCFIIIYTSYFENLYKIKKCSLFIYTEYTS